MIYFEKFIQIPASPTQKWCLVSQRVLPKHQYKHKFNIMDNSKNGIEQKGT